VSRSKNNKNTMVRQGQQ